MVGSDDTYDFDLLLDLIHGSLAPDARASILSRLETDQNLRTVLLVLITLVEQTKAMRAGAGHQAAILREPGRRRPRFNPN